MIGCIFLQGMQRRPELQERHLVLGKVDIQTVRNEDLTLDRKDRRLGPSGRGIRGKADGSGDRKQDEG